MREILFIQGGGGHDTHDAWDQKLVNSFSRKLGDGWEVHYPRMPDEDDPQYAKWAPAIREAMAIVKEGVVLVGHSIGGTMLVQSLAEQGPPVNPSAIVLLSAPFIGAGGWPGEEFSFADDLGAKLPRSVPVHIFHGLDDDTAPPAHADLYARAIGHAEVHKLPGRDHQLNNDLHEVADIVEALP